MHCYYSHVLYFPADAPFDKPENRFQSFVGEFVLPLIRLGLHDYYWFSYYDSFARFRIYTDRYEELRKPLEESRDNLKLTDKNEEKHVTLLSDLGGERWLSKDRLDKRPEKRALLILQYLHSIASLYSDYLQKRPDGYWELERSTDTLQNPEGSSFESLHHLLCNMTKVVTMIQGYEIQPPNLAALKGIESPLQINAMENHYKVQAKVGVKVPVHF